MAGPRKKKKRAYHHGDLRRALLDAAVELVAARGAEALSLRELARHAGVSPAAPYHHFASKNELLRAIAIDGFAQLAAAMTRAKEAERGDAIARLRAIGEAYVRFAVAHPSHFELMFRRDVVGPRDRGAPGEPARAFQILLDGIAEVLAVSSSARRAGAPGMVVLAWSVVHGAAGLVLEGPLGEGVPELGVEAGDVPALVSRTFESLISERP